MNRFALNFGAFFFGVCLALIAVPSFAATYDNVPLNQPYTRQPDSSRYYTAPPKAPLPSFPDLGVTGTPFNAPTTTGGSVPITLPTTATADLNKVGQILLVLARNTNPLLRVVSAVSLLCSSTSICTDITGAFTKPGLSSADASTATSVCKSKASQNGRVYDYYSPVTAVGGLNILCYGHYSSTPGTIEQFDGFFAPGMTITAVTPSDADWTQAATTLNTSASLPSLWESQTPIPITGRTFTQPVTVPVSSNSIATRDATGTVTGTQTTTVTTTVTPAQTAAAPDQVTINETKTVVNYDTNNTVINSTTTNSSPAPQPPKDVDVTFDNVPDVSLGTQNLTSPLTTTSWGSGTCPSDPTTSVLGTTITIPVHIVCGFMTTIHGIVLALGALISAYIIAGARKE